MKFVRGVTLRAMLESSQQATRRRRKNIHCRICSRFSKGVRRDCVRSQQERDPSRLKPENMIGGFGEVLVMDWGLAKVLTKRSA